MNLATNASSSAVGKGPIQPHISNLPRRKPKTTPIARVQIARNASLYSSTTLSNNAGEHYSASTDNNRTNSQVPVIPPSASFSASSSSSSSSSSYNDALTPFEQYEHVVTGDSTPSVPHSLALALPKPKGHIQPHASNVPRRKRNILNPEEIMRKRRQAWTAELCLQEVMRGSGIWISFDPSHPDTESENEYDYERAERLEHGRFAEETSSRWLARFKRTIQIIRSSSSAVDGNGINKDDRTIHLVIPSDHERDDGVPALSKEQLFYVAQDIRDLLHSDSADNTKDRILITAPLTNTADAIALAIVACRTLGLRSVPFADKASRDPSTEQSHPDSCTVLPPAIQSSDPFARTASKSSALTLLARMHDLEDLGEPWRGSLSCDGVEYIDETL